MGGAPFTGPRLGEGPIFEASVSCLDAKEHIIQARLPIQSKGSRFFFFTAAVLSGRGYDS